jgi:hypothetical protein
MSKFTFKIYQKQASWVIETYDIEANNYNSALSLILPVYNKEKEMSCIDYDTLDDSEDLDPIPGGLATRELYCINSEQGEELIRNNEHKTELE